MSKFAEKVWGAFNLKARTEDKNRLVAIIDAALKKQREALEYVLDMITQLPGGIDEEASGDDESPPDMVAHIGGLIYRRVNAILNAEVEE